MMKLLITTAAYIAFLLAPTAANPATVNLIGDLIFADEFFPCATCEATDASFTVNPFTVGPNVETSLSPDQMVNFIGVDFDASSLVFTVCCDLAFNPGAFNGPEFFILSGNPFGDVVSVSSPPGQPVAAFVSGGVLFVNWQGDSFLANDTTTITFGLSAVPEPSTWAMMLLGLAGLGFAFRNSRRKAAAYGENAAREAVAWGAVLRKSSAI